MKVSDAELEYREKYAYLPSTQSELIEYLEKNLKLDKNKIEVEPVSLVEIKKSSGFTKYLKIILSYKASKP